MNEKSTGMVGEMPLSKAISGQFEFPQLIVRTPFSFVVTCSDLPKTVKSRSDFNQGDSSPFS